MPEPTFSPDLLLIVGADVTQLRQQLSQIERELGIQPVNIRVGTEDVQRAVGALNNLERSVVAVEQNTRRLRAEQEAFARAYVYDVQKITLEQVRGAREYEAVLRRLGVQQVQAEKEYQNEIRNTGVVQSRAIAENEQRTQNIGRLRIQAEREYESAVQRSGRIQSQAIDENARREERVELARIRRLGEIERLIGRLNRLSANPVVSSSTQLSGNVEQSLIRAQSLQTTAQAGGTVSAADVALLRNSLSSINGELQKTEAATASASTGLSRLFDRFGRYVQIAGLLTVTYTGFRAAFAAVEEIVTTDKTLRLIEATAERSANKFELLRSSYELIVQGNQVLGKSFEETGRVVFELQKALDGNVEQIKGAYIPALALASTGEGNQTEIIKTLIGTYELFGDTLGQQLTPLEKYTKISDSLLSISIATVPGIEDFRSALQTVAPAARASNVSLDATLSLLAVLQQGMQSASRAGTGLARLFADIRESAPRIGKIFDIPIDINKPVDTLKVLLEVAQKIRDVGPQTTRVANQIRQAFGDERAERALLTLVELLPRVQSLMARAGDSAGRTKELIDILGGSIEAAFGRLKGTAFDQLNRFLADLQGVDPGKFDGVVQAIDKITAGLERLSFVLRTLALLPKFGQGIAKGDFDSISERAGELGAEAGAALAKRATPAERRAVLDYAKRQGITFVPAEPDSIQGKAAAEAPFKSEFFYELKPLIRQPEDYRAELEATGRRIQKEAQDAVNRNNPLLDFDVRINLAQNEVARARREAESALKDFGNAVFGRSGDQGQAEKQLTAAYEKLERAQLDVIKLRREDAEVGVRAARDIEREQLAATAAAQQLIKEISSAEEGVAKITLSNALARSFVDADNSAEKFNRTVNQIRESLTIDTSADTDKLRALQGRLFDSPGLSSEQIGREYDRLNELIAQKNVEATNKIADGLRKASLGAGAGAFRDLVNSFATGNAVGLDPDELQKLVDKAGGVTDLTEALQAQAAVLGLWGAAAAQATLAAKFGFASVEAVFVEFERTGNPVLAALIETIQRLGKATSESGLATINTQIDEQSRALQSARGAYGQVGEAAERWALALSLEKTTYDRLEPAQRDAIDRLAKITTGLKDAAAAAGLFRLGFSAEDADALAKRASEINQAQQQAETGIGVLRTLNEEQRRARDLQDQFIQESAKASGAFLTYFASSLRQAANQAGDFSDNLKTLAQDTAQNMQTSFSDFFFDTFTGKLQTTEQLWNNFLTGMLRALSDFMSKQLVRSFLNILTGTAGGEGGGSPAGGLIGSGGASALGGVIGGFSNLFQNAQAGGVSGSLFGLPPVAPSTVNVGLPPSNPDLEFAGFAPTSMYLAGRPATSGLIGTGGQASKELSSAGAILAAYTAAQSVIKLTSDISTERDRNSGTGGLVGAGIGGAVGAYVGGTAIGAGVGGLLGSYLGGLFGSNAPPAGRFDEINRTISTVQTALETMITSSKSFTDLFNTLLRSQGGGSLAAATGTPIQFAVGGQNIAGLTQSEFLSAVRANPSSLKASVQAGVNPSLLGPLNQEVVNAVLTRIAALDQIGQQINETIANILAETVVPVPTGGTSLETLKQQAVDFRAVVDQLIATNVAQTQALEQQLAATTDPALVLQYTTTIKGLIEKRYQDETQLVQKFAGQLDSLATSLKSVSSSIEKQIFDLQLSNFGPTNPLAGLQLARGKFDTAKATFFENPTPENAQALQALVDPLLKSASEVFTRPSPEYRAIFDEVVATLEQVKGSVDAQANDISDALAAALGTSNSLQDLTQKNTAAMAADMKQLLAIVTAAAAASGINLNAGTGILLPGTFTPSGQPVQPYQDTRTAGTGNQTAAGLTAAGVLGLFGNSGTAASSIIGLADKLGLTDWLKGSLSSLFTTDNPAINPATAANYYTGGGPDAGLVAPPIPEITIPEITIPNITLNLPDNFSYTGGSYSFLDIGTEAYSPDYSSLAFQSGGHVPGAGSGDTVPAMLEPGEFVIPRRIAGPLRPFLENLIGGQKNIPTGPHGLHFATGGTVPFTAQDVQALLLLQALLGVNNNQIQTQQQIASNTQLTADILQQLAQRSGLSVTGSGSSPAVPTTPNLVVLPAASPSGGLSHASTPVPSSPSSSPAPAGPQGTEPPSEFQSTLNSGKVGLQTLASVAKVLGYQGVAQSAVGLAGIASLIQGIQAGNPYVATSGGLTAGSSLAMLLSQPGVAQALGLSPGFATGAGIAGQGLSAAAGAVGVVQSLQSGNYLGAAAGGAQTLSSIANILANPAVAQFFGYGTGPLINSSGAFTPTLGGALGAAGAALGVVGGGLNVYQGIQSGQASQIASGAFNTILGASALSGYFGGPTIGGAVAGVAGSSAAAGAAATPAVVALGADAGLVAGATGGVAGAGALTGAALAATVGYIALPVAVALGIWGHQEGVAAEQMRRGIIESNAIRRGYAEAIPNVLAAVQSVNSFAGIGSLPPAQQVAALLNLKATLEQGWQDLADVSRFISTRGVGNAAALSTVGRADTTQAELIARVGTPVIAAGLARVYDALALRGEPVFGGATLPTSSYDIAALLNATKAFAGVDPVRFQAALQSGQFAGLLSSTAPGQFSAVMSAIFSANNPQFSQSSLGAAIGTSPSAVPTGTNAVASLEQRQESIAQTREYVRQTGDTSPISAIAPYVPGGTATLIRDALPAWGLDEYAVTQALGPDAFKTMSLMQIKSVMDALQQLTTNIGGMAAGGWVSPRDVSQPVWGRGRDTVLRLLEPGEFIVPSQIARANAGLLEGLINDGAVRADYGSTISTAARSGDYRSAGGVSQVALNIHPGAIQIDGAKDPRAVSREVLDSIEQNIRTGRLGHVIVTRVRQTRG